MSARSASQSGHHTSARSDSADVGQPRHLPRQRTVVNASIAQGSAPVVPPGPNGTVTPYRVPVVAARSDSGDIGQSEHRYRNITRCGGAAIAQLTFTIVAPGQDRS